MKRALLALAFGWYVVTYTGQAVAGPFGSATACNAQAQAMINAGYAGISSVCRFKL